MAAKQGKADVQRVLVDLKTLPDISVLKDNVQAIVDRSSWWEVYGVDWVVVGVALLSLPCALLLLAQFAVLPFVLGMFIYGCIHAVLSTKAGHSAAHGAVVRSPKWNKFWSHVFVELIGSFSANLGYSIHVIGHHTHTNIIGLGDSSMWKAPFLPRYVYMFVAPLLVPALTPLFALFQFRELGFRKAFASLLVITAGLAINFSLLMHVSGFTLLGAVLVTFSSRAFLAIPYIHVNIFQHIGLTMFSQDSKPKRIYQMSTGVLNLPRNLVLDWCFGHSIISCHVEHHLFPKLSDNMCLKVKPVVRQFLLQHGLPYNEKTYWDRLKLFINKYEDLMVHAPPITHFIGIQ
ncbi:fatty acid desaturase 6-like [Liolophura sinensis]|uniref:fatty acid desaturase 6-like n=1 Tax=Liolophura sinensis TaxID=3198878 RepID=UPI003158386D